jgi:hypothetical protein
MVQILSTERLPPSFLNAIDEVGGLFSSFLVSCR